MQAEVVFMLDASRSIRDGDVNKIRVFVGGVVRRLAHGIRTRVSLC